MKKYMFVISIVVLLLACGGSDPGNKKDMAATDISENPDYKAGLALISRNNCLTCHKVDEKLQGPAYRDVANKYAGYPDTIIAHLGNKIIRGGTGVWGELIMLPQPSISQADAEAMVKYILLLKK